jgi:tyrosyl-tRNA synthetase
MTLNPSSGILSALRLRSLLHQATDEPAFERHLAAPRAVYCGFDPTADSLTIGNLVPIMLLAHFQRAGHTPIVVMGGGTGLIGDPSGKTAERQLRTREEVQANVRSQMRIFRRILDFDSDAPNAARMVDNADWLCPLGFLDALRDVGKHFSVNMMIQKESVKERLHNRDQGISYTEFSYMILQAYDFLVLFRDHAKFGIPQPVSIQLGGSDQWGNMVGGIDLIRRVSAADNPALHEQQRESLAYCLTAPLVTKSDGGKFGKTEAGAIWLTPERTSPYAFYQFWLNTADADVIRFLKTFTFLPMEEIARLETSLKTDPGKREAHKALAREATRLLHGEEELTKAQAATAALFGKKSASPDGGASDVPFMLPEETLNSAPSSSHDKKLLDGVGMSLVDLLAQTTLAKSKTEARTLLSQNSISVNGHKAALDARVTAATLLPGGLIALRRGGKTWHITRWA